MDLLGDGMVKELESYIRSGYVCVRSLLAHHALLGRVLDTGRWDLEDHGPFEVARRHDFT